MSTFELYDIVRVRKDGKLGSIVFIDDDDGTQEPIYLIEMDEKNFDGKDLIWAEEDEIELVEPRGWKL